MKNKKKTKKRKARRNRRESKNLIQHFFVVKKIFSAEQPADACCRAWLFLPTVVQLLAISFLISTFPVKKKTEAETQVSQLYC